MKNNQQNVGASLERKLRLDGEQLCATRPRDLAARVMQALPERAPQRPHRGRTSLALRHWRWGLAAAASLFIFLFIGVDDAAHPPMRRAGGALVARPQMGSPLADELRGLVHLNQRLGLGSGLADAGAGPLEAEARLLYADVSVLATDMIRGLPLPSAWQARFESF